MAERTESKQRAKGSFEIGFDMGKRITGEQKDKIAMYFFAYIIGSPSDEAKKEYPQFTDYPESTQVGDFKRFWANLREEFPEYIPESVQRAFVSRFLPLKKWRFRSDFIHSQRFIFGLYEGQASWEKLEEHGIEETEGEFQGIPVNIQRSKDPQWSKPLEELTASLAMIEF